jgi:hypothetical protein
LVVDLPPRKVVKSEDVGDCAEAFVDVQRGVCAALAYEKRFADDCGQINDDNGESDIGICEIFNDILIVAIRMML